MRALVKLVSLLVESKQKVLMVISSQVTDISLLIRMLEAKKKDESE